MFTVLTLNLHNLRDRWLSRRHLIVSGLLDEEPDLIALQEVNVASGQGAWLLHQLNARLGRRTYQLAQQRRKGLISGFFDGVAVLSKHPILLAEGLDLGFDGQVALLTNIELPSGYAIDFVSARLSPGQTVPEVRYEQVMRLTGWLGVEGRSEHQIVAGDFNEGPEFGAIRRMKQSMRSAHEIAYGREPLATFPTALALRPNDWSGCLDYIFLSTRWRLVSIRRFGTRHHPEDDTLYMSDHIGLLATVTLRQEV